jgi:hypothetical protein
MLTKTNNIMKNFTWVLLITTLFSMRIMAVEGDVTSPELHYVSVTPDTVANGDSITVWVKASDSESPLSSITVTLRSPHNTQDTYINGSFTPGEPEDPYWMSAGDSVYKQTVKLTDYAVEGNWYVSGVWIYDENFNSVHSTYLDSTLHEFYVISSMGDDDSPQLIDFYFNSDTLNNGDSVTVFLNIKDTISGLENAFMILSSPSGMQAISFNGIFHDTEGDMWDSLGGNLYSTKLKISDFAEGGDWNSYLNVKDMAGNNKSLEADSVFYVISSSPDLEPPLLNKVIFNPDTVIAGDEMEILVNTVDSLAGVAFIQVAIRNFMDTVSGYIIRYGNIAAEGDIVNGEEEDGSRKWEYQDDNWYKNVLVIPDSVLEGYFNVVYVRVADSIDNSEDIHSGNYWDSVFVGDCYATENKNITICEGKSYTAGGGEQTISGTYYDTLSVPRSCDTIVVTHLKVTTCTSSLNEEGLEGKIKIYPNPVKNSVQLDIPENISSYEISVVDVYGNVLLKKKRTSGSSINVENYPEGIYYLRIYINGQLITHKIIKTGSL